MGHEIVDHTSEIVLRLRAPTYGDLIAEGARGFASLVPDRLRGPVDLDVRTIEISASDPAGMLVDWLNELVYRAETECWLADDVQVRAADEGGLAIRARGIRLERPFVLVKAATLHDLELRSDADGIEAEVTLDV